MKSLSESMQMNRTGMAKVSVLIGLVILIVMITAVAPTMFSGSDNITGAPSWFDTVFPLIIAASLILLAWRSVGK